VTVTHDASLNWTQAREQLPHHRGLDPALQSDPAGTILSKGPLGTEN